MAIKNLTQNEIELIELELFLEALHKLYRYDFKNYLKSYLLRRVKNFAFENQVDSISSLIPLMIQDSLFAIKFVNYMTIQYSSLFRDALFFKQLSTNVFPYLSTFARIKIWIAGCANGEEIYSMVILLKEAGLLEKTTIYATDISHEAIYQAKLGILNAIHARDIQAYNDSGGIGSLSEYFVHGYGEYKIKDYLLSNVIFEKHNLIEDNPFVLAHLVLCRNVMIYFNQKLQNDVFKLLNNSLMLNGYLGIGMDEKLEYLDDSSNFKRLKNSISVYKKLPL